MVAIIDPATGDYETVTPELTGQALEQLITGENGFEKPYENGHICIRKVHSSRLIGSLD